MGNILDDRSGPNPFSEKTSPESGPKLADYDFLDLIVHHPEAMERLSQIDYEMIISDPATRDISRSFFDRFHKEGDVNLNDLIETLEEKTSRELLREVMMSPSRFPPDMVAQVVSELGEKANARRRGSVSAALKQGGLEKANALLQKKRGRLSKTSKQG
jgi:hypothetical protein